MKIAIASADKTTVAEHFGTVPYFVVLEVEGEDIVKEEVREKPAHKALSKEEEHAQVDASGRHGFTGTASIRHKEMGQVVNDCKAIIVGRMGTGAYEDLKELGFEIIATDVKDIKEAASLYAKGELSHKEDRLH